MNTKLTLKMDRTVVDRAKRYAQRNGRSLSGIAEDYFRTFVGTAPEQGPRLSGTVAQLAGIARTGRVADHRTVYRRHIEAKYG